MVSDYGGGGSAMPPLKPYRNFGVKLYDLVSDPSTDSIISWSENGNSFIVWKPYELCNDRMLARFNLNNHMPTFTKQLSTEHGFRKVVESEQFEYANDHFVRGRPDLLPQIHKWYIANLPPDPFRFKRSAEAAKGIARMRAVKLAMEERIVTKTLSNLSL